MPSRSRRALLQSLASGSAALLAGCDQRPTGTDISSDPPAGTPTDTHTPTASPTETSAGTGTPEARETACDERWGPTDLWRFGTGLRVDPPELADGTVYFGGDGLHAVEATDGTERWRRDQRVRSTGRPAVEDGTVAVSSYAEVAAFDAADGAPQWTSAPPGEVGSVETNAVVARGTVVSVTANRPGTMQATSVPRYHRLVARDLEDGATSWRVDLPTGTVSGGVAAADGTVLVTVGDGRLLAVDVADGARVWEQQLFDGTIGASRPVVGDDAVYVHGPGELVAVGVADGSVRWRRSGPFRQPPVVGGDVVYCATERTLVALDAADGTRRWRTSFPVFYGTVHGARPSVAFASVKYDDHVALVGFDADRGCRLGRYEVDATEVSGLDHDGDTLFVGDVGGEGELHAVTAPDRRDT